MKVHRGKRWDNFKINKKDFEKSFKKLLTNRKAHDIISELRLREQQQRTLTNKQ